MKVLKSWIIVLGLILSSLSAFALDLSGRSGTFTFVAHPTFGEVTIVTNQDGQSYLILSKDFKTDPGPDLKVVLHKDSFPSSYTPTNYVNLGKLIKNEGAQVYKIPAHLKLEDYHSAVIWCKEFNVNFGVAELL